MKNEEMINEIKEIISKRCGIRTIISNKGYKATAPLPSPKHISQVINGLILPIILVLMLVIINDKSIMGEYVNSKWYNYIAWAITIIITILVVIMIVTSFIPVYWLLSYDICVHKNNSF